MSKGEVVHRLFLNKTPLQLAQDAYKQSVKHLPYGFVYSVSLTATLTTWASRHLLPWALGSGPKEPAWDPAQWARPIGNCFRSLFLCPRRSDDRRRLFQ